MTSIAQIRELVDVLGRDRLRRFVNADEASAIVENIGTRAAILHDPPGVPCSPDPMDNQVLAAAIVGGVDLIVSGDKRHMHALRDVDGIPVVTARKAPELLSRV